MDCPRCTFVLDHPDRALAESAAWTDLPECCRETLELVALERGMKRWMQVEPPPAALDEAILKAAARHAAPALVPAAPLPPIATAGTSIFSRLRHWVTAPQVAMATITALAVVIGVFYVPSRERLLEEHGDTVMATDSDALLEAPAPTPTVPTGSTFPAKPPAGFAAARPVELGARGGEEARPTDPPVAQLAAAEPTTALATDDALDEASAVAPRRADDRGAAGEAEGFATLGRTTESAGVTGGAGYASRAASAPASAAPAPPAAVAPSAPGSADLLAQARALRSRGQCAAAVPLYDRWLADPSAGGRAEATVELADCLVATGRTERARQLYARATTYPAVASRAREEIAELDRSAPRAESESSGRGAPAASSATRARAAGSAASGAAAAESADAY